MFMKEIQEHYKEKLALLEAMLFTTHKPLSIEEISKNLRIKEDTIKQLLHTLKEKYSKPEYGIKLSDAGGYKLVVKHEYVDKVSHLTPHADLSRGVLRVLSIIAFHDHVEQSEIVKVVGNRTYEYVKELEKRGFIKSEKKGRTKILTTTPHFEDYFGIKKGELKILLKAKKDSV